MLLRAVAALLVGALLASACGTRVDRGTAGDRSAAAEGDVPATDVRGGVAGPSAPTSADVAAPSASSAGSSTAQRPTGSTRGGADAGPAAAGGTIVGAGSTVASSPTAASQDGDGSGLAAGGDPGGSAATDPGGEAGSDDTPGGDGRSGSTGEVIRIGVHTVVGQEAAAAALGAEGISSGDNRAQAQAVIDHLNERGGIAGRQIEPIYFEYETGVTTDPAQEQEECVYFTEDHDVDVVIPTALSPQFLECLAQHDTPLVGQNAANMGDAAFMEAYADYFYSVSHPHMGRWVTAMVDGMVEVGFLTPEDRIGMVRVDEPQWENAAENYLKPQLAAHGLELTDEAAFANIEQGPVAVVRFQSQDINKVIILDNGGAVSLLFINMAASNNYNPDWGMSSLNYMSGLDGNVPDDQLENATGLGWFPLRDVKASEDPDVPASRQLCLDIMRERAGETYADRVAEAGAVNYCDALFFLAHAMPEPSGVQPHDIRAAVEAVGETYTSPVAFGTRFGPGRHDGPLRARMVKFDSGECTCFRYLDHEVILP